MYQAVRLEYAWVSVSSTAFDLTSMADSTGEERVIVNAALQRIPGNAGERPFTLGNAFSRCIYDRPLRINNGVGPFDAVHVPRDVDSEYNVKRWFMFDIGVTRSIARADLGEVPLKAYTAEYDPTDNQWYVSNTPPRQHTYHE